MPIKTKPTQTADPRLTATAKPLRKSLLVLKLLSRAKGGTLAKLMQATGWRPHSARAHLSRLRTKGIAIAREKRKSGATAYCVIAGTVAAVTPLAMQSYPAGEGPARDADATVAGSGSTDITRSDVLATAATELAAR